MWHAVSLGEKRYVFMAFVRRTDVKRPLGRPRHGWSLIKMYFKQRGLDSVGWIYVAQDRNSVGFLGPR